MNHHSFHIPVMGTGFTIDTPLKVARYGISSVVSVEDNLMEKMRKYYCQLYHLPFEEIASHSPDSRARRITAYLDMMNLIVKQQLQELKASSFEPGTEITKYFDLLDENSSLKKAYQLMTNLPDGSEKIKSQYELRSQVIAGSIDVNILTKLDRERYDNGEKIPREYSDALSALRGFAKSSLYSSIVFSAGLNPHLYSYAEAFDDFYVDASGNSKKKIVVKVSDFRSAYVQGKIFAKKGLWVSEFRIESGINCGGHAFPTPGVLLGPILEEFKSRRHAFKQELFLIFKDALKAKRGIECTEEPSFRITAQGGIGTNHEKNFLMRYYELDGTGWGTPFLLVPEVTSVDDDTLKKLVETDEKNLYLSRSSPLGVPIYSIRNSESERTRLDRLKQGKPGSPCLNQYMAFNTEFTKTPVCTASSFYQQKKIEELKTRNLTEEEHRREFEQIVEKACICHDLGDSALMKYQLSYPNFKLSPAVCPGPNLVFFSKIYSLKEMVGHIYGRQNVLDQTKPRPHVFINELKLYLDYLRNFVMKTSEELNAKQLSYCEEFKQNLKSGIEYYKKITQNFLEESEKVKQEFLDQLADLAQELDSI